MIVNVKSSWLQRSPSTNHLQTIPYLNSFPNTLYNLDRVSTETFQWRQAPPSPFFEESNTSSEVGGIADNQKFTRELRKSQEIEDPEEYYNDWILSNVG